ncbi:MAG: hypothetical protein JWO25_2311 [Alphaproteobacteria bacterium]|nr:hypothetical protein [Alphaproteobacteria bacterium]
MIVQVGLGARAQKGGAVIIGIAIESGAPRLVLSTFLATAVEGDRLSLKPYHVAAVMDRGPQGGASEQARAAVAEGRKRQDGLAAAGLDELVRGLEQAGGKPVVAALLVNRAGWVTDLLDYSLAFAGHAPVAEGLAVRDAFRFAFARSGVELTEMDEKSLPERAPHLLRLESAEIEAGLKALGASAGRPWRKEQKLACLAAWTALAAG